MPILRVEKPYDEVKNDILPVSSLALLIAEAAVLGIGLFFGVTSMINYNLGFTLYMFLLYISLIVGKKYCFLLVDVIHNTTIENK